MPTTNDKNPMLGKIRRGAIRIGLEVIQGLNMGDLSGSPDEEVPEGVKIRPNIPYINRKGIPLAMDVFQPVGEKYDGKELPVIVNIHGGGLVTGDRKMASSFAKYLAKKGYLVFAIEYRLAPRADVTEQFDDICAGMDLVGEMLLDYEVDYGRIFMTADSAGAFLAIYTAAMKNSQKLQESIGHEPSRMIFKALGLTGGMFYTNRDDILGALLSEQFYGNKKDDSIFLQYMNPEHPEIINNLPPTFLVTSRGDFLNGYTIRYQKALKAAGKTTRMLYYPEEDLYHTFNFTHPDYPQSLDANEKMLAFFEEQADIAYENNKNSRVQERKTKSIEKKIEQGSFENQRLWKTIREINSISEDSMNQQALKDDSRVYSYRQMFRNWEHYAGVFSGLRMTGRSHSRVGMPGAMTREAVFAFYGLDMTGALISLLPCAYMDKAERLIEAVRDEGLTDLILTDYETRPDFLREIMDKKEELGLKNVILLHSDVKSPGAGSREIKRAKENTAKLKKIPGLFWMDELLISYEAYPVTSARLNDGGVIFHRKKAGEDSYVPVEFKDAQINADLFSHGDLDAIRNKNILTGLCADLSVSCVLKDQLQRSLYTGNCVVITHRTGFKKGFLKRAAAHHMNVLYLYKDQLSRMMECIGETKLDLSSLDALYILGAKPGEEELAGYQAFFEKHGARLRIEAYRETDEACSTELFEKKSKLSQPAAAQPANPYWPVALPYLFPAGSQTGCNVPGMYAPGSKAPGSHVVSMNQKSLQKGKSAGNPLVWEDKNGNRHDLVKIAQKLITSLLSARQDTKKGENEAAYKAADKAAAQMGSLMKILAGMFDPDDTDYYYEA